MLDIGQCVTFSKISVFDFMFVPHPIADDND